MSFVLILKWATWNSKSMDGECMTAEAIVKYTRVEMQCYDSFAALAIQSCVYISVGVSICECACCIRFIYVFFFVIISDACHSPSITNFHAYQKSLCDRFYSTMGISFHFPIHCYQAVAAVAEFLWFIVIIYSYILLLLLLLLFFVLWFCRWAFVIPLTTMCTRFFSNSLLCYSYVYNITFIWCHYLL